MRVRPSQAGFTLIEMMTVIAIIGIMSALAVASRMATIPGSRLNESTTNVQTTIMRARHAAVRTGRFQKVCLYRDNTSTDAVPRGKILRFECPVAGDTACIAGNVCLDVDATNPALFTAASVTCLPNVSPAPPSTSTWCLLGGEETLEFDPTLPAGSYYSRHHTSILGFANVQNAVTAGARNEIEITFSPSGIISAPRSTFPQGTVLVTNYDFCTPGTPPGGTCTGFSKLNGVNYVLGGQVRTIRR